MDNFMSNDEKSRMGEKVKQGMEAYRKTSSKVNWSLILSVIAIVLGGAGFALGYAAYSRKGATVVSTFSGQDSNSANFQEGSIADVADKVSPSVVSIVTSVEGSDWFGRRVESAAAGTGIIVSADGYILTNKHVIDGATAISVVLDDGTTYEEVKIAATDPNNDVAYLKIPEAQGLAVATLGDSKTLSVGEQVMAIGNAMGQYQNTVTVGVISGLGRTITASDSSGQKAETLSDMIQTDAAINSGNSGGPLVNAAGEVIGINTATSYSAENMGFAIPISAVKGMLAQLTAGQTASRAYLGVYSVAITPDVAKEYNLSVRTGAYVYSGTAQQAVVSGSPAAKAGIQEGDVIVTVNGAKVGESGSLPNLIAEYKPGDTVQLGIIRNGKELVQDVTLEEYRQ